jgi:ATP-dependent helicase/nuclease subunit A
VAVCETEGDAASVAGLVAHLDGLAADDKDEQAALSRENAVFVGTLHSAKGLEWPVTVLHALDSTWKPNAFGVHVANDREGFDFEDPLGGRWIRYWPDPYAPENRPPKWEGKTEMHDGVRSGTEHGEAERRESREMLRLLYVGWTRARDRLVLAGRSGKVIGSTLGLLKDRDGTPLVGEPEAECVWAGRKVTVKIREVAPSEAVPAAPEAGAGYAAAGPREFPPATRVVSSVAVTGTLGESEVLTGVPFVQLPVDWAALGSAVHAFFAGDRPGLEGRVGMAEDVLARWGVQGSMRADDLLAASDALQTWAARRWPHASWHREWPVRARESNGTERPDGRGQLRAGGSQVPERHARSGAGRQRRVRRPARRLLRRDRQGHRQACGGLLHPPRHTGRRRRMWRCGRMRRASARHIRLPR